MFKKEILLLEEVTRGMYLDTYLVIYSLGENKLKDYANYLKENNTSNGIVAFVEILGMNIDKIKREGKESINMEKLQEQIELYISIIESEKKINK